LDQLLIALDVKSRARALELADQLRDVAGGFKIGSRLFTAEGPDIVRALTSRGDRVFLDLKFHDIPNTVRQAVAASTSLGVWMLNVHASGGLAMLRAAKEAATDTATHEGRTPPLVIAVTVLTSMDDHALEQTGVHARVVDQVVRLAELSRLSGLDGVVASPQETELLRGRYGAEFAIVTPGIRGGGAGSEGKDDQERTMTAAEAVAAGASYIVVGRPIIAAHDPRAAALSIAREMAKATAEC
jgi:orotidine-5'-phosphate decarboxylase